MWMKHLQCNSRAEWNLQENKNNNKMLILGYTVVDRKLLSSAKAVAKVGRSEGSNFHVCSMRV